MGQIAAKAKQGGDQAAQKAGKDGKVQAVNKSNDADELIKYMENKYDEVVKHVKTFDEFYHAFHELIEMFCGEHGQLQYKIPSTEELKKQYEKVHPDPGGVNLTRKQFMELTGHIVKMDSFTFGKAAIDVLVVLFGAPVCALFVKRIVPGLKSFSDDVVIPVATSGAVVYLAKANKL